ncbi:MAG: recombinase family protein [Thermohalobaculum sp.]
MTRSTLRRYVIYKRVSTKEQGRSGLGLEAQDRDIRIFLETFSEVPWEVVGEFLDILTGTDDSRPQLTKAIDLAKREKATLLVSKLDRLSRKVSFIANLMEDKKLKLRVASLPHAEDFELHVWAALAQQERKFISERTKAALREAKARGQKLGGLRDKTMKRNEVVRANAVARAQKVAGIVVPLRVAGRTFREIAGELNRAGVETARGGSWQPSQVMRVLERLSVDEIASS